LASFTVFRTGEKTWANRFDFWAVKTINRQQTIKWLLLATAFWGLSSLVGYFLNLPVEQFMLDIKVAIDSFAMLVLIITTVCIVIPIVEELVFRGWSFSKIAQTKLGNIGALLLTSVIFTVIHSQYENFVTLVIIFHAYAHDSGGVTIRSIKPYKQVI